MNRPTVEFVTRDDCPLCDEARSVLGRWARRLGIEVVERNIDRDAELAEALGDSVPVVRTPVGSVIAAGRWSQPKLAAALFLVRIRGH